AWAASHDDTGVAGYQVYRNGTPAGTTPSTSFTDTGLAVLTSYSYTVAAFDYFGNTSAPSAPLVAATTGPSPTFVQQAFATPKSPHSVVTASHAAAQTAGNANILAIGWNDTASSITSVTDRAGNVYVEAIPTYRGSGLSQAIYYAAGIAAAPAGTNQVTVTFDRAAVYVDLRVTEYSWLAASGALAARGSPPGGRTPAGRGALPAPGAPRPP